MYLSIFFNLGEFVSVSCVTRQEPLIRKFEPFRLQESRGAQGINVSPDHYNRIITQSISKPHPGTPLPILASTLSHLHFGDFAFVPFLLFTSYRKLVGLHRLDLRLAGEFRFTE
jgi:hypothetical protein